LAALGGPSRKPTRSDLCDKAQALGYPIHFCSSLTGEGVKELFQDSLERLYEKMKDEPFRKVVESTRDD